MQGRYGPKGETGEQGIPGFPGESGQKGDTGVPGFPVSNEVEKLSFVPLLGNICISNVCICVTGTIWPPRNRWTEGRTGTTGCPWISR